MTIGVFVIYGQDNDSYAFRSYPSLTPPQRIHQGLVPDMSGKSRTEVHRCEACGQLTRKWEEPLSGLVITKRKYDVSITYDGIMVFSEQFKSVFEAAGLAGLEFLALPDDSTFYSIRVPKIVAFDAERRMTRFIKQCPRCGQYESVAGATPVYLKPGAEIDPREFVQTDLEFGSGDEKHPLLLCGNDAAQALMSTKLKGVDLIGVEQSAS